MCVGNGAEVRTVSAGGGEARSPLRLVTNTGVSEKGRI